LFFVKNIFKARTFTIPAFASAAFLSIVALVLLSMLVVGVNDEGEWGMD